MRIPRRLITVLFLAVFFLPAPGPAGPAIAEDVGFLSVFEDMPLMPGLTEDTERAMVFDKPEGRIVEAVASGQASAAAVSRFYAEALPQLGWRAMGGDVFRREGEELRLEMLAGNGGVTVRFASAPIGAAGQ
ncbi:MAG: hypothetical protein MI741_14815 [Rhodospirillales bacterium]|nr:hypothetical protein [Rhodospirillales bacterium]